MAKVRPAISETVGRLREPLGRLARQYDAAYLQTDPLKFAHRYSRPLDREAVAFLSAAFAFGNIASIFQTMERLLKILGPSPAETLRAWPSVKPESLRGFRHRWIGESDLHSLLRATGEIYRANGSLKDRFLLGYDPKAPHLGPAIVSFSASFRSAFEKTGKGKGISRGLKFLIPSPASGSSCKRLNLFFRWVVRTEPPDLGLWKEISPSQLLLPIDTHLERIVRYIGLTKRATLNWKMVAETTENLARLDPADPVRFDFALARLGILDRCRHKADPICCPLCPLQKICVLNKGKFLAPLDRIDASS